MQFSGDTDRPLWLENLELFDGLRNLGFGCISVQAGKIAFVGERTGFQSPKPGKLDEVIDCTGLFALPGFVDSHLHLFSLAASNFGYDLAKVSGTSCSTFKTILKQAKETFDRQEIWLRFYGLDSFDLGLSKCLNRDFLDEVFPENPVIIRFQSGHGALLNSVALGLIDVGESTDEPDGITFTRDLNSGLLTGVILEGEELFASKIPPIPSYRLLDSLGEILEDTSLSGITTLVDASQNNDVPRMRMLSDFLATKSLCPHIVLMPGSTHFRGFSSDIGNYSDVYRGVEIGHVKIMLTASSGRIIPSEKDLLASVREAHSLGFPVAIHAVENECVSIAIAALQKDFFHGDRIEHASELTDQNIAKIAALGIRISTQPGFITENGERYLQNTPDTSVLYRLESLRTQGVVVGFSSDAPFSRSDPMGWIYAGTYREIPRTETILGNSERIPVDSALNMATYSSALVSGIADRKGYLRPGMDADIVLLDMNPLTAKGSELSKISPVLTLSQGSSLYSGM